MRFNYPLVAFFLAIFVSARPVELLHSRQELRMLSRAHDFLLQKKAEMPPMVTREEWALLKRENVLLTQLMTQLNQSGLGVTFIKTFTESALTQPTVINLAENFLKTKNLTTILADVDLSGLGIDVVVLILTDYNVLPGLIQIAEGITGVSENSGGFLGSILGGIFGFSSSGGNSTATGGLGEVVGDLLSLIFDGSPSSSSSSSSSSSGGLLGGILGNVGSLLGGLFGGSSSSSSGTSAAATTAAAATASTLTSPGSDNLLGFLTDLFPTAQTTAGATSAAAVATTRAATAATTSAATATAATTSSLGGLLGGILGDSGSLLGGLFGGSSSSPSATTAAAVTAAAATSAAAVVPATSVAVAVPATSGAAPAVKRSPQHTERDLTVLNEDVAQVIAARDINALTEVEKRDAIDPLIQQVLDIIVSDATVSDVIVSLKKSGLGVSAIRQLTTDSSEFAFVVNLINQLVGDGVLSFLIVLDAALQSGLVFNTAITIITSPTYFGLVIDFVLALFEGKIAL